jgi:3-oxoacyl-[acyl-carrier-protein] synthase III
MPNAYISGTGGYVPDNVYTNDDLVNKLGIDTTHEWIVKRTGIEARRFADEGMAPSDLGARAATAAIERAGLELGDIGMILFATLSPDMAFPGSGVIMQKKMGFVEEGVANFVPCMDIRNQCSGFVYGLGTAASMVQSGAMKHVLVVGAEVHSAALDLTTQGRNVASLFGDGAGAVVVSATDADRGIRTWSLGADGTYADVLCQRVWDTRRRPFIPQDAQGRGIVEPEMMWAQMDGKVVFKHAVEKMSLVLMQACWKIGITPNDVDLFCFHQANLRINEYVQTAMGIPDDKVISNIQKYGNTTAATIPLLLAEAERSGKLQPGMKVAMVAFGSGFTWGCAIADW